MLKIVSLLYKKKEKEKPPLCTQVLCDRVEIILDTRALGRNNKGDLIWLAVHGRVGQVEWRFAHPFGRSKLWLLRGNKSHGVGIGTSQATNDQPACWMGGRKKQTNKQIKTSVPCSLRFGHFPSKSSVSVAYRAPVGHWVRSLPGSSLKGGTNQAAAHFTLVRLCAIECNRIQKTPR